MAWSSVGSFVDTQSKTGADPWTFTTSAALEAGNVGIICIATDVVAGGDNHLTLTDAAGNTWTKVSEQQNFNGTILSVWWTKATATLGLGANVILDTGGTATAKAATGWEFSVAAGSSVSSAGTVQGVSDNGADPSVLTMSGLTSGEYLFFRGTSHEGPNTDGYTPSANYTAFTHTSSGTTGDVADTNQSIRGEFRILTGTGDSTDPTYTAVDHASLMGALKETLAPVAKRTGIRTSISIGV